MGSAKGRRRGVKGRPGDNSYRRRNAWEQAKRAFGPGDVTEQLTRLERCELGCPRVLLAAAIHYLLSTGPQGAAVMLRRYMSSFAPLAEMLSVEEIEELEALEQSLKGRREACRHR